MKRAGIVITRRKKRGENKESLPHLFSLRRIVLFLFFFLHAITGRERGKNGARIAVYVVELVLLPLVVPDELFTGASLHLPILPRSSP